MTKSGRRQAAEEFYFSMMAKAICCTWSSDRKIGSLAKCEETTVGDLRNEKKCGAYRAATVIFSARARPKSECSCDGANDSLCPEKENGHADPMLNATGGCAKKDVRDKAVSVRAHRHQVAALLLDPFDDFISRLAVSQFRVSGNAGGLKLRPSPVQIRGIFGDLGADRVRSKGSCGPTVSHVEQHHAALREFHKLFYVFNNGTVGWRAVQRHENGLIHTSAFLSLSAFNNMPSLFHGVRQTVEVEGRD